MSEDVLLLILVRVGVGGGVIDRVSVSVSDEDLEVVNERVRVGGSVFVRVSVFVLESAEVNVVLSLSEVEMETDEVDDEV